MELRQLKYFVAVAEKQHFGRAAEQLFISQPALSQQIRLLEESLGVELLDTTARKNYRKVKLTPAGEHFLAEAKKLIQQARKLEESTKQLARQKQVLRLGVYKALLKERIEEFMEGFVRTNPNTEIVISEYENYLDVQDALLNREIDKGLTLYPLVHPGLKYEVLKTGHLSVILSRNHPLASREVKIEQLLKTEKWIELAPRVHPVYKEIEDRCHALGVHRQVIQEVSSLNLLISLVGLNNGIGFAPSLFDFSLEPRIVVHSLEGTVFEDIEICHILAEISDLVR